MMQTSVIYPPVDDLTGWKLVYQNFAALTQLFFLGVFTQIIVVELLHLWLSPGLVILASIILIILVVLCSPFVQKHAIAWLLVSRHKQPQTAIYAPVEHHCEGILVVTPPDLALSTPTPCTKVRNQKSNDVVIMTSARRYR